jgi:Arc/MetJ-type ribon-helix-helix transcriptional regulator
VQNLAKKQHQSVSELVRAALRLYLDHTEREAALTRAFAYGRKRANQMGVASEVQAIVDQPRHSPTMGLDAPPRRR